MTRIYAYDGMITNRSMKFARGPGRLFIRPRLTVLLSFIILSVLIAACGTSPNNEGSTIAGGIRAPLADFMRRDAPAFCSDFTPAIAARLGRRHSCQMSVERAFALVHQVAEHYGVAELPSGLVISNVRWQGNRASATTTWPWPDIRRRIHLDLEKLAGRWRVATPIALVDRPLCARQFHETVCRHLISMEFSS